MMQSNEATSESPLNEREAARDRLARQIGRLLANEWLRNRAANPRESSGIEKRSGLSNPSLEPDGFGSTPNRSGVV
jgi:hypothetical protein